MIIGKTTSTAPGFDNVLILAPPLVLDEQEADLLATTVEQAIHTEFPSAS